MVIAHRHLLYISNVVPGPGNGGRIIVDRHLRRLAAEGWNVTVVTPLGQMASPGPWREVRLPARRWWWPPFRPSVPCLARLRTRAWRHELTRTGVPRADAIATVCWGPLSLLAASLANSWNVPLVAMVHDWWQETGTPADILIGRYTCTTASTVFAVSTEMQSALRTECARSVGLLYPLPATRTHPFAVWREDFRRPTVAHVGTLQNYHENFLATLSAQLASIGGHLLLLCPRDNPTAVNLALRCPNLLHQDFFPENSTAVNWVAANASALVVMYSQGLDAMGRPPTGFPSRFVEFAQIGLPILLAAPAANPIRTWAKSFSWQGSCDPEDTAALSVWMHALTCSTSWATLAAQTRRAASSDFDPDSIHRKFRTALGL